MGRNQRSAIRRLASTEMTKTAGAALWATSLKFASHLWWSVANPFLAMATEFATLGRT